MARQLRLNIPGSTHHITARGNDRQPIFTDDGDRRRFLALLAESSRRRGCAVLAFCLMTNHIHLVVRDDRGEMSRALQYLKGVYAQWFNQRHGRAGHLFEGRFWNSMFETDTYLTCAVEYVHRNPAEAGLVESLVDYRWSSYPSYLGVRTPPDFLELDTVRAFYGNDVELMRHATERNDLPRLEEAPFRSASPPPVVGSDDFRRTALARRRRSLTTSASYNRGRVTEHRPTVDDVIAACAVEHELEPADLLRSVRGRSNLPRAMAIHVAHRFAGASLDDLMRTFRTSSSSSVSMASGRFGARVADDPALGRRVDRVTERLGIRVRHDDSPGGDVVQL